MQNNQMKTRKISVDQVSESKMVGRKMIGYQLTCKCHLHELWEVSRKQCPQQNCLGSAQKSIRGVRNVKYVGW